VLKNNKASFFESNAINNIQLFKGKIVLATNLGVNELREDYIQPLQLNTSIDFSIIYSIFNHNNSYYLATNKGLWVTKKNYKPKETERISSTNFNKVLKLNKNILAISTLDGIKIIKKQKIASTLITAQNITAVLENENQLWVATKTNGLEVYNSKTYQFIKRVNKYNSGISNKINTIYKDFQNNIWVGSSNKGLYKYSFLENSTKNKPKINFETISINYKSVPFQKKIWLKNKENNISFSFKTIDLANSKNIKYRYQLNQKTSPWSYNNSVDFASLEPGDYVFSIQSKIDQKLSPKKTINFYIDSPIYKKSWFFISIFSILAFLIAIILDLRIKKIKKKNIKEVEKLKLENHLLNLEQKALQLQMNPHFIFNVLNGIKSLGNSGKTSTLNDTISHFSLLLRNMLESSRLEEITLKQEIETMNSYLSLEQLMNSKSFKYQINTSLDNIDAEEILIPPMLIQPFLENAIKHGVAKIESEGNITLSFEVKHRFLECSIIDNGVGIHESKKGKTNNKHKSVAIKITKERIENISKHSSFIVEEIKKENTIFGTKIWFKLPLKTDY
ncbi:MAG: histidine kinase, partial [Polaribacter sp.]